MPQQSTRGTNALLAHLVCLVLFAFVSVAGVTVRAATLYGKVIEVNSGDVITISNLNRPVRIKLLGVDAPEMNQAFGDVAKKHLSDLVFDKGVLVNYSGISSDSSLTGRVLLNDADIGAQMIRDGAAWFDPNTGDRLATTDREVYQQSELAARSEHRGLWQDANPTAPWEFVKAERLRKYAVVPAKTNEPNEPGLTKVKRSGSGSELNNISLMSLNVKAAPSPSSLSVPSDLDIHEADELPAGLPFTAFPPRKGMLMSKSLSIGGEIVKTNGYVAGEGGNGYSVMWFTAPAHGEDDKMAMDQLVFNDLSAVTGGAYTGGDAAARCNPQSETDISSKGYWGREIDMSQCQIPTRLRVFTRATGDRREVYLAMVSLRNDDANVARFLKTFTVGHKAPKTQK
jgi:endonuclease YncB( thermonuclease family)